MKNKFIKRLKKSWLTIWIVAAVAALSTIGGMAAYTSISSVKRVVSTQKGVGNLFSSNYLEEGSSFPLKNVTFSSDKIAPTVTVNVCNFPQTKIKHSDADITYTLTITLVDSSGTEISDFTNLGDYSVKYGDDTQPFLVSNKPITYTKTLSSSDFSQDNFTLSFDISQLTTPSVYMKLVATPSSPTDLPTLSATIGVSYVKPYSASWSGQFTDSADKPSDLDGFNYRLSGSGSGTIILSWNTKYIEISKWFLEENTDNLTYDTDKSPVASITLRVDSSVQNQYDIQFYRVNGISANESWTTNKESISVGGGEDITTCKFTADEATE